MALWKEQSGHEALQATSFIMLQYREVRLEVFALSQSGKQMDVQPLVRPEDFEPSAQHLHLPDPGSLLLPLLFPSGQDEVLTLLLFAKALVQPGRGPSKVGQGNWLDTVSESICTQQPTCPMATAPAMPMAHFSRHRRGMADPNLLRAMPRVQAARATECRVRLPAMAAAAIQARKDHPVWAQQVCLGSVAPGETLLMLPCECCTQRRCKPRGSVLGRGLWQGTASTKRASRSRALEFRISFAYPQHWLDFSRWACEYRGDCPLCGKSLVQLLGLFRACALGSALQLCR